MQGKLEVLLGKFGDKTQLNWMEGLRLWAHYRNVFDPVGWLLSAWWWTLLFLLAAENGKVSLEAIRAQYDGTLFYQLEQKRKLK